MHRLALILFVVALPLGKTSAQTRDERERLTRSLETACTGLSDEREWPEADACRRAWFAEHEEAVWRLRLNPHAPKPQPPS